MNELVQVGWRSKATGEMCDCPVYERSPHADSEPVLVTADVFRLLIDRGRAAAEPPKPKAEDPPHG